MSNQIIERFRAARNASCGLVAIETADYAQTVRKIASNFGHGTIKVKWDIVNGPVAASDEGLEFLNRYFPINNATGKRPGTTPDVFLALLAENIPDDGIIFLLNFQAYINDRPTVIQALWNLRDIFKTSGTTLVLLSPTTIKLPCEVSSDVFYLEDPLPNEEEIKAIIAEIFNVDEDKRKVSPAGAELDAIVRACLGLSDFCVEQAVSVSFDCNTNKVDQKLLWDSKVALIKQQQGLEVSKTKETFEDVGGLNNIKSFLNRVIQGDDYNSVVYFEEIEKTLAGSGTSGNGDSSGVSQDQLGSLLTYMEEHETFGVLLIGPPGTSKSALAKATGAEIGVPSIQFDLGACKGSLVGQSEQNVRAAFRTVDAVSQGKAIFIASCNKIDSIPPELRRRFAATFFVDLPNTEERKAIWKIWKHKFNLPESDSIAEGADDGWSGGEIKTCCKYSSKLKLTINEAKVYIAPVSQTSRELIDGLRKWADGRFLSASHEGTYKYWPLAGGESAGSAGQRQHVFSDDNGVSANPRRSPSRRS